MKSRSEIGRVNKPLFNKQDYFSTAVNYARKSLPKLASERDTFTKPADVGIPISFRQRYVILSFIYTCDFDVRFTCCQKADLHYFDYRSKLVHFEAQKNIFHVKKALTQSDLCHSVNTT